MRLAESRAEARLDTTRSGGVYRASVPICSGGMLALALEPRGDRPAVFAGGGDGVVRKVVGYDMRWKLDSEVPVDDLKKPVDDSDVPMDELKPTPS